jgi:DNA-binding NarL/FixJ family response regulator
MEKLIVTEINAETGEVIQREFTEEEVKEYEAMQKAYKAEQAEIESKVKARQSALAKLAELGLTEEEIASL